MILHERPRIEHNSLGTAEFPVQRLVPHRETHRVCQPHFGSRGRVGRPASSLRCGRRAAVPRTRRTKSVVVLGSTGSIGRSTLEVIAASGGALLARALSAWRSAELLEQQARLVRPRWLVLDRPRGGCRAGFPVSAGGGRVADRTGSDPPHRCRAGSGHRAVGNRGQRRVARHLGRAGSRQDRGLGQQGKPGRRRAADRGTCRPPPGPNPAGGQRTQCRVSGPAGGSAAGTEADHLDRQRRPFPQSHPGDNWRGSRFARRSRTPPGTWGPRSRSTPRP